MEIVKLTYTESRQLEFFPLGSEFYHASLLHNETAFYNEGTLHKAIEIIKSGNLTERPILALKPLAILRLLETQSKIPTTELDNFLGGPVLLESGNGLTSSVFQKYNFVRGISYDEFIEMYAYIRKLKIEKLYTLSLYQNIGK